MICIYDMANVKDFVSIFHIEFCKSKVVLKDTVTFRLDWENLICIKYRLSIQSRLKYIKMISRFNSMLSVYSHVLFLLSHQIPNWMLIHWKDWHFYTYFFKSNSFINIIIILCVRELQKTCFAICNQNNDRTLFMVFFRIATICFEMHLLH